MYVHAGAFGAATVGFGAAVVGKNKYEIKADALVEGWKEQATTELEGNFKDPEVFLAKLTAHEEEFSCKIYSSLLREHVLLIVICLERNVSPLSKLFGWLWETTIKTETVYIYKGDRMSCGAHRD